MNSWLARQQKTLRLTGDSKRGDLDTERRAFDGAYLTPKPGGPGRGESCRRGPPRGPTFRLAPCSTSLRSSKGRTAPACCLWGDATSSPTVARAPLEADLGLAAPRAEGPRPPSARAPTALRALCCRSRWTSVSFPP